MITSQRSHQLITLRIFLLVLSLPLIISISYPKEVEIVIVNKAFHGREIKIRLGGFIQIDLEELGPAGYTWEIKDLDKEYFEVVSIKTDANSPPGDMTGKPVIKTFLIGTKKPGKAELRFLHYRPWEGEKNAVEGFFLKVRIF